MPVELATKTPKRTSKQMTSNSPCTSIALGLGNPANSGEVGVEGCEGGFVLQLWCEGVALPTN